MNRYHRTNHLRVLRVFVVFVAVLAALALVPIDLTIRAQDAEKTVADGVYTDAQAARGAAIYEASCAGCHRADLGGGTGPALRDQRFTRQFAGKDLKTLFTKAATSMPRNAPGTLGDNAYLDVVAHLLKENGFPSGSQELSADALAGIRVLPGRPKPLPPVGEFSYVDVVGCLTADPRGGWLLTRASTPVAAAANSAPSSAAAEQPLGAETYHLLDAMAYTPERHKGEKVYVRGLLIKLADQERVTISVFEPVSPRCNE